MKNSILSMLVCILMCCTLSAPVYAELGKWEESKKKSQPEVISPSVMAHEQVEGVLSDIENTEGELSRDVQIYSGCGVVAFGPQSCLKFLGDDGHNFFLDPSSGLLPGEYVYIQAEVDKNSLICFPFVAPALVDITVSACFEEAGVLGRGPQSCMTLTTLTGGETYLIENTGGFFHGAQVYVKGGLVEDSAMCFPVIGDAIVDNEIYRFVDECGTLGFGPQGCLLFNADSGDSYAIENVGNFLPGQRVRVAGVVEEESQLCFPATIPAVVDNIIGICRE